MSEIIRGSDGRLIGRIQKLPDGSKTVSSTDGRILGRTNSWGTFASGGRRLSPQQVTGLLFGRNLEDEDDD
ncbi:MAG: hypothetical protein ABSE64_15995 [Vulcanimicrobiaceae bacterium]|jgi:hypothetical protein